MRTYTLESVERKITNINQFLDRAAKKQFQLGNLLKIRDNLLSPENAEKAVEALDRKRKEMARLETTIALARANGTLPETEETEKTDKRCRRGAEVPIKRNVKTENDDEAEEIVIPIPGTTEVEETETDEMFNERLDAHRTIVENSENVWTV